MTMNTNNVLYWFKEFKYSWLPQNVPNDNHLFGLITTKLNELEHILNHDHQNANELSIADEYLCEKSKDTEHVLLPTPQVLEHSLVTSENLHNNHSDAVIDSREKLSRPAIRLKRIPLAEAEFYMPSTWKPTKSKRARKKGQKKLSVVNSNGNKVRKNTPKTKVLLSTTQDGSFPEATNDLKPVRKSSRPKKSTQQPSSSSLTSISTTNGDQKKSKRKLRAPDGEDDDLRNLGNLSQANHTNGDADCEKIPRYIGQNGILSQTRKTNETTTLDDGDFRIKLQSRRSNQNEVLTSKPPNETTISETLFAEPLSPHDDAAADDDRLFQAVIDNNDNDSLFASLDITRDKTHEINSISNNNLLPNYNDCIEDISNDGIDPPPSSSSPDLAHFPLIT